MPQISIVLPTYNGAKYIAKAIDSVLNQTVTDWELIIVDSYSQDGTADIIAAYAARDTRIRIMQHPKDPGRLPGALNAGFDVAQGKYHTWLSDDNEMVPESLAKLAHVLDTKPEVGLVYSHFMVVDDAGKPQYLYKRMAPGYLSVKNIITPSFLYRAELYRQIGGYRIEYFTCEDYDFWMRSYEHTRFVLIDEPLHLYRFHEGNLTATEGRQRQDFVALRLLKDSLAHLKWIQQPYHRANAYMYMYRLAVQNNLPEQRSYWRQAFKAAPLMVMRRWLQEILPAGMLKPLEAVFLRLKQQFARS
jgi:glycosyltransferase involved in cell wall biosynthesis